MKQRWHHHACAVLWSTQDFNYFRSVNTGLMRGKGGRKPPFFIATLSDLTA